MQFFPNIGGDRWVGRMAFLCWGAAALLAVLPGGCGKDDEANRAPEADAPAYPDSLSADSSPREVAEALIGLLDAGDREGLAGLVASRAAAEEIDAIFRKHGRTSNTSDAAAAKLAASGWCATYATWQKRGTQVVREVLDGDEATVLAAGMLLNGQPAQLKIRMVREAGLWKVLPGLQTLAGQLSAPQ